MTKRKVKSRKVKKNNSFSVFLVIVIILALISFAISYFVMQTDSEIITSNPNIDETIIIPKDAAKQSIAKSLVLDGTWASYNDGAMLTISGQYFSIELPSVESTELASGKIVVKESIVTFVYTNNDSICGIKPGVYKYKVANDEVIFTKENDNCGSRIALLVATWFKV